MTELVIGNLPANPYDGNLGDPVPITLSVDPFVPNGNAYLVWCVFNVDAPCYYGIDPSKGPRLGGGLVAQPGWQTCATLMEWDPQQGELAVSLQLATAPIADLNKAGDKVQFQNFKLALVVVNS